MISKRKNDDVLSLVCKAMKKDNYKTILNCYEQLKNTFFPNNEKKPNEKLKKAASGVGEGTISIDKALENRKKPIANDALVLFILLVIIVLVWRSKVY